MSSTLTTYTNTFNFTKLSNDAGYPYNTFSTPLTNNKILLFMTAMNYDGTDDSTGPAYPLTLLVNTAIISTMFYEIKVTNGIQSKILILRYCKIIFD